VSQNILQETWKNSQKEKSPEIKLPGDLKALNFKLHT